MRIISGTAGGLGIKVPPAVTRPTTDRVREAVFSMLGDAVCRARVLDVFSGSGAMGIECLSRGAAEAQFIEQHPGACTVIEENLARAKLAHGRVIKSDAFTALRRLTEAGARFDLIFADPPYAKKPGDSDTGAQLLASPHLRSLLAPGGFFVLETMVTKRDTGTVAGWNVVRDRAYGSTRILILQSPIPEHAETSGAAALQPALSVGAAVDGPRCLEKDAHPRWEGG